MTKKMPTTYWNKESVEADPLDLKTISQLKAVRAESKALKAQEGELLELLEKKYTAEVIFSPLDKDEVLITRNVVNSNRLDTKRLKEEKESIYKDYCKASSHITWKFPKEKEAF